MEITTRTGTKPATPAPPRTRNRSAAAAIKPSELEVPYARSAAAHDVTRRSKDGNRSILLGRQAVILRKCQRVHLAFYTIRRPNQVLWKALGEFETPYDAFLAIINAPGNVWTR